jgi:hypothetical protein
MKTIDFRLPLKIYNKFGNGNAICSNRVYDPA